MSYSHTNVLKKEAVEHLVWKENGLYLDVTCGGGGHSEQILSSFPNARVICFDWDLDAIKKTKLELEKYGDRATIIQAKFSSLYSVLKKINVSHVDGILADFGTSRHQLLCGEGFSFQHDTYLDMRMSSGHHTVTAADLINKLSEKELAHIFYLYGEERYANKIAREICTERQKRPIKTTLHLASIITEMHNQQYSKIHPATKIFQALRIAVNDELKEISSLLNIVKTTIKENGRFVAISFHSLEDRLIKEFAKNNKICFKEIIKGIVKASEEEVQTNPASRSAKMRILEKKSI